MNKRLFIGFPVQIESSLEAAIKRTKIDAQKREMEVQWIPVANYHVTLNFLGNTPVDRITALESLIDRVCQDSPPIATSLKGMGAFPDERHMRVLWIGVRKSRALAELQERLRAALVDEDFPQEDRDYSPHLTIGRLRKSRAGGDLLSPYVRKSFGEVGISRVVLFESLMSGPHVVYRPLSSFELRGAVAESEEID